MNQRAAQRLLRAFRLWNITGDIVATDEGVSVDRQAASRLLSVIAGIEGGSRVPFIGALLNVHTGTDVVLRGDEPHHLARQLEELHRQHERRRRIDRGQFPGAMSAAEVARIWRRHPHLFRR